MDDFEYRTGLLNNDRKTCRYLWTDAFAVFNYLELYRQTDEQEFLSKARILIDQVHSVLGRHRLDDTRKGWISGLDEQSGQDHPTAGGLRIGKDSPERKQHQFYDASKEWDRDGQYFHYLIKWMLALHCLYRVTNEINYLNYALELANTAFIKFSYIDQYSKSKKMHWKMSIDLSYPLVESMGQHDPLDGLITYLQLQHEAIKIKGDKLPIHLDSHIKDLKTMCASLNWMTSDALGIGGLLTNACALIQLLSKGNYSEFEQILIKMLEDIKLGIVSYLRTNTLLQPAVSRLAFREIGLSIGLHALEIMKLLLNDNQNQFKHNNKIEKCLKEVSQFEFIADEIDAYWLDKAHSSTRTWNEHYNINNVMLATSLMPRTYLWCH